MKSLQQNVEALESELPKLERQRNSGGLANDLYEAVDDWRRLGQYALGNDARVNYPVRAREELGLLSKLQEILRQSQQEWQRYSPLLETAGDLLEQVAAIQLPKDGYLGVLRIVRQHFAFLCTEYSFQITDEQPTGARFSSNFVYVKLEWSKNASLSCSFGPASNDVDVFWLEDLLFLYADDRYKTVPKSLNLDTERAVDEWFRFVADIFKKYGTELLTNRPGIFDRLTVAQKTRDAEYVAAMNKKHGSHL
jgi:hypothetical protein